MEFSRREDVLIFHFAFRTNSRYPSQTAFVTPLRIQLIISEDNLQRYQRYVREKNRYAPGVKLINVGLVGYLHRLIATASPDAEKKL